MKWTRGTRNDDVIDVRGRRGAAAKLGGGGIVAVLVVYVVARVFGVGDVEAALAAASAIGDDRLQQQAGREVDPETFTHGTSEQRVRWFRRGFETGRLEACDTFSVQEL